jgi:ribosomal 50S subunit-recycling heat shock protein
MRLDLFLKASRLVIRRTVAQAMCDGGAVEIGGAAARSSRAVRVGDEITLQRGNRRLTVRVLALPATKQVAKADAATLYEVVREETVAEDDPLLSG